MRVFLERNKVLLSANTVLRYMNRELHLYSIVRRKKPAYQKHPAHKVLPNLIKQNFQVQTSNRFWCTDFTYLYLKDGSVRYNCAILDLHDHNKHNIAKIICEIFLTYHVRKDTELSYVW